MCLTLDIICFTAADVKVLPKLFLNEIDSLRWQKKEYLGQTRYPLIFRNERLITLIYNLTRRKPISELSSMDPDDVSIQITLESCLKLLFHSFSLLDGNSDAFKKLKGRFIDAACYRESLPTVILDVPDILIQQCSRLISPDKHFKNLRE
jgi:hypothetical protein